MKRRAPNVLAAQRSPPGEAQKDAYSRLYICLSDLNAAVQSIAHPLASGLLYTLPNDFKRFCLNAVLFLFL